MAKPKSAGDKLLAALQERAKELNCLYEVEEALGSTETDFLEVLEKIVLVIPPGWQYSEICLARITYGDQVIGSAEIVTGDRILAADLEVQEEIVGKVEVFYTESMPVEDEGPFLKEEARLVRAIARRISQRIMHLRLKGVRRDLEQVGQSSESQGADEWRSALMLLRRTDKGLYVRIARKMLNHLCTLGIEEAGAYLRRGAAKEQDLELARGEVNGPGIREEEVDTAILTDEPFELASLHLGTDEVLRRIQKWMLEDRASYFTKALRNERFSLPEVADALRRYHLVVTEEEDLPQHSIASLRVALIRRLLTEQLDFITVAKGHLGTQDFQEILERVIMPGESYGKLGGKAAGLILAQRILNRSEIGNGVSAVKVPLSWYVVSSAMRQFITYNDLEDVFEQKYKSIEEIRNDYPSIIRLFKSSRFPPDVIKSISVFLDDLAGRPLIVRSSSLLEDRFGTAFSGKYKSLFLPNQGTKQERTDSLLGAIAEIYASVFGPDPIEYRRDRELIDFNEEMGILIQEVVGQRMGRYFLPAFAGVAFSNNEFRWSPRIQREDGLLRLVPGLGTRAVDRVGDDYPVLVVPNQPTLRVNATVEETVRYSPQHVDLVDLEDGAFRTVRVADLIKEHGAEYPAFDRVFSVRKGDMLRRPNSLLFDEDHDEAVVTFEGLLSDGDFVPQMSSVLEVLRTTFGKPVDLEFAHDGTHLYLLQCRTQTPGDESAPAPIPREVDKKSVLFSANRHVSNGWLPDLTHLIYVDPEEYGRLGSKEAMLEVGRVVGRLNKLLPRRRFALLGPGRWGSRGDISLGVSVTYADIHNTALLVEIARAKGSYVPDLSFGTHFFQDLVESRIRYLPLYPDEDGVIFQQRFFLRSNNCLPELLPHDAHLANVVKVLDIPRLTNGKVLRVLMNADLDEAMGLLVSSEEVGIDPPRETTATYHVEPGESWRWRLQMAEELAAALDPLRFGVVNLYVFGSTKNATAGPKSDIDLLVHTRGTTEQKAELALWLEGWDLALAQMNYLRTGYHAPDILDVHYVTDEDIEARTCWAVRIGAVTDAARPLPLKGQ